MFSNNIYRKELKRHRTSVLAWSISISALMAVLAGVWPALRAARIDPIRALRGE